MKNPQQGSRTGMVRQNARIFPVPDTITPNNRQTREQIAAEKFAAMGRLAMLKAGSGPGGGAGGVPAAPPGVVAATRAPGSPGGEDHPSIKSLINVEGPNSAESELSGLAQNIIKTTHSVLDASRFSKQNYETYSPPKNRAHRRAEKGPQNSGEGSPPFARPADLTPAATYAPERLPVKARHPLADVPPLAELVDLEALRPKRGKGYGTAGAGALAELLDHLARHTLTVRPYQAQGHAGGPPRQIVLHLSAEMLAATLGRNQDTVNTWTQQLAATGYLAARPHYTTATTKDGERVTAVDGTLYAIRLQVNHNAYLSYQDLNKQYRNLDADRQARRTARRAVQNARKLDRDSGKQAQKENTVSDEEKNIRASTDFPISSKYLREQLRAWAVTPGQIQDPLLKDYDPRIFDPEELGEALDSVREVIYLLPSVAQAHPSKRPALIGILGATLARVLHDDHSRRWYCKLIWQAWDTEQTGRAGLQHLAAQLTRLDVDRREWGALRRPAALLAARLRAA